MDLIQAVISNDLDDVRNCINSGMDLNIKDQFGWSALMIVISQLDNQKIFTVDMKNSRLAIVKMLIEAGADLNVINNHNQNAFQLAAYHGSLEVIRMLLNAGVDLNIKVKSVKSSGLSTIKSAEHWAYFRNHVNIVMFLKFYMRIKN